MTKWLSNRIHRTNWNQCTAGYGSLKVDPNSQVRFCTSPHRSLQLSSPMDLSFVIRPKGDVFLSFTTLLIESKCKKNSVSSPVLFTVLRLHCIHHTKFDLYRCGFDCACFSINNFVEHLFHNPSSESSKTRQQSPHPISPRQYQNSKQLMRSSIYQ